MKQYETTVILSPVLSEAEVKKSISKYNDFLKTEGAEMVAEEHWGLRQLAYPIRKKTTGIYHTVEYKAEGEVLDKLEVLFRRDPEILRFLSVRLDKYSIKYNDDKRNGLIGRKNNPKPEEQASATDSPTPVETAAEASAEAPAEPSTETTANPETDLNNG